MPATAPATMPAKTKAAKRRGARFIRYNKATTGAPSRQ